jgi:hypothetical protein
MIGTDDGETMMIEHRAEMLRDVSDMRGKLYLWISFFTTTHYRVFILRYEYPTSLFSLHIYKGNKKMGIRK